MWNPTIIRFRAADAPELMAQAWRLRYRVFRENLGWEISSVDLLEFDGFDRNAWHCGAVLNGQLQGYWRALSTVDPYLLEHNFESLLGGKPPPKSPKIWEMSRFAMAPNVVNPREVARLLVRETVAFGRDMGADQLLAVSEPSFERFVTRCGLPVERIAGPMHVGQGRHGDVHAVLMAFNINAHTLSSMGITAEAA